MKALRGLRRFVGYALAAVLVLMALVAVVAGQLLPLAERNPDDVARWLSSRAGRTVAFDRLQTEWTRRGPLLRLEGLRIGDGEAVLPVGDAEVLVAQYGGLLPGRSFTELRIRGLQLDLRRADDGRWSVRGLPGDETGGDPLGALEGLGELQVVDAKLTVAAPALGLEASLPRVAVRLRVQGDRVRAAVRAWTRAGTRPADVVLDFDRRRGDGRAWLSVPRVRLDDWTRLRVAGIAPVDGEGRVEAWAGLRGHRVAEVMAQVALSDVRVAASRVPAAAPATPAAPAAPATPAAPTASVPSAASARAVAPSPSAAPGDTLALGAIEGQAQWRGIDGGWRLDAPRLRVGSGAGAQVLDGLTVAGGTRTALRAGKIDAGPLLALAALSDRVPAGVRAWLRAARPDVALGGIEVAAERGGALRIDARVDDVRFAPVGKAPGLSGLAGDLRGDAGGLHFAFDPAARAVFDWPTGFGVPHPVRLEGGASAWRDGDAWRVETGGLRVAGDGYGAAFRGGLAFPAGGGRPSIALAADVDDAAIPLAKRFWVHHSMPKQAIAWLDAALQGGHVRGGRAVVAGDLADWPFLPGADGSPPRGLFHATATIDRAVVKFQPGWPATDGLTGRVDFIASGFRFAGRTQLAGVAIDPVEADIARFGRAPLLVRARSRDDAEKVLALLRDSPLAAGQEETLAALSVSGPAAAAFALDLPLDGSDDKRIAGVVDLDGAKVAERRWNVALADVRGQVRYDQAGFTAADMAGRSDGEPATFSVRSGDGHVATAGHAFEADLSLRVAARDLLAQAPDLGWLRPYVDGASAWTVSVAVPRAAGGDGAPATTAGTVALRSDLVGTRLALPAPLDKPAPRALPARIALAMPLGDGEVSVAFGQLLALRARSAQGRTGVRVAVGSGTVAEAPPASGLVATGRAPRLDPLGWATVVAGGGAAPALPVPAAAPASGSSATAQAVARGGGGAPGTAEAAPRAAAPLQLQRIDVTADTLPLLGAEFANVRVQAGREGATTRVRFDGDTLAGTVDVPDADGAAIDARLQRLHWRRSPTAARDAIVLRPGAPPPPVEDTTDPARIPPLRVAVDDLRIGEARLGEATFASRRMPGGMRIERLQSRNGGQRLDATGDWTGRGAGARTRLSLQLASDDFGKLLEGFGQGGRIAGGNGEVAFDAAWAGTPMAFSAATLEGRMVATLKDGQLVDVEPGAGRVLGLLSITELPRRLMLDFRDFFSKGFGFNRIHGTIAFAGGQARSEGLEIDGPSALIRIGGAADLRSRTYDQTIEVEPRTGNLLAAVGALTAGPVGAAVGAVANVVLAKPIGAAGMRVYRVTGPFAEPKVEVVDRAAAPAVPAPAPASAGAARPRGPAAPGG